jgi:hypothetical protein
MGVINATMLPPESDLLMIASAAMACCWDY